MKVYFEKYDDELKTFHYLPNISLYKHRHGDSSEYPIHLNFCIEFGRWYYEITIGKDFIEEKLDKNH